MKNKNKSISRQMMDDLMDLYEKKFKIKEGLFFGGLHEDGVSEIVRNALHRDGNKSVTIKVSLDQDEYHLNAEIKRLNDGQ